MSENVAKQQSPPGSPGEARVPVAPPQVPQSPTSPPEEAGGGESPPQASLPAHNPLPGSHWTDVPFEPEAEDPALDDNISSTASLSSSILRYRTVQGRTYHSDQGGAEYWGANDERQNEALDIAHHLHTLTLDGELFLAPINEDIQKVVDIGTGTGLWAMDVGDSFPSCEVIGTDISPIQSTWVPPNVKFQIDDCERPWTFEENSIDFIHMRYLLGSIQNWPGLLEQAFRCTKPGGYVESFEGTAVVSSDDGTVADDSAMAQWGKLFVECGKTTGRSFTVVEDGTQRASMEKAGFVDIREKNVKVPVGQWPKDPKMKELGTCTYATIGTDVEGYVTYMASLQGWSKEEVIVYAAHLRREMRNPAIHGYYKVKVVYGRKPGAS